MKKTRVLLADDHTLMRAGMRVLLDDMPAMKSSPRPATAMRHSNSSVSIGRT